MNKTETSLIQVNRRGFSKQDLVQSLQILERMAKYDFENRIGSKSRSQDQDDVSLDMKFFEHFRGKIEMCLPIDPNLCGNLEVRGKLKTMLPEDLKHAQDRVAACRENFEKFCMKMFGENYQWIHYVTSEVCGDSTFSREKGANKVTYSAVTTYKGESDSILGTTFVSFLVLLLFIWGMLMIVELRSTFNFLYVVWYTPSTQNSDPTFASFDQKMEVNSFPISHKIFAVLCIGIPRGVIAVVVLVVGARFLSATNNLQDLVLNTTDSQQSATIQYSICSPPQNDKQPLFRSCSISLDGLCGRTITRAACFLLHFIIFDLINFTQTVIWIWIDLRLCVSWLKWTILFTHHFWAKALRNAWRIAAKWSQFQPQHKGPGSPMSSLQWFCCLALALHPGLEWFHLPEIHTVS